MKISQEVRNYAEQHGMKEKEAIDAGMEEKAKEFIESGGSLYIEKEPTS